ncbi:hypothetical protein QZH41_019921 [Actinostola sp. cb2023]|nr:hypothetical protein QZH41_019921 [Actinostola sp. cb2023]
MALCGEEFFSKFRSFASTLGKDCNELKSKIENNEISSETEGRSHLILREILADAQKFKADVDDKVSQMQDNFSFGEVLSVCERLTEHTKTQIDDLHEHLGKYGYKSPGRQLPQFDSIYANEECNNESSSTMESDGSDVSNDKCQSNSDSNDMETDKISSNDEANPSSHKKKIKEDDLMSTPVKPDTFTPMIQATPPTTSTQIGHPRTPDKSPVPPNTTTPMLQVKTHIHVDMLYSPPNHTPPPPSTFTPLLKTNKLQRIEQTDGQCFQSPLPPMLNTPGLKMLRLPGHDSYIHGVMQSPDYMSDEFGSPTPPDITCTVLLKPEDLVVPTLATDLSPTETQDRVMEQKYQLLPMYLKNCFSIQDINNLLREINGYFKQQIPESNSISEDKLRDVFNLGHTTKAFMLILDKLGRAKVMNGEVVFTK